ncbi:MAG: DUF997 family protein [Symbiopectobacterium sp.]
MTLFYLVGWIITAYLPDNTAGLTGLPRWFEFSCLPPPLVFIVLFWLMTHLIFRDIPLGDDYARRCTMM